MKVLVTGACGYIGKYVVNELISQGHDVIANDYCKTIDPHKCQYTNFDILSNETNTYYELGEPDILIHLAWKDGFVHNSDAHLINLSNHYRFINNMIRSGCKNITVMGTMHEVGYWEGEIDQNTPCNPLSKYGVSKNALRQSLFLLKKELDFNLNWLRAYYIYGDDIKGNSIFSKIAQAALQGKKQFPFTMGTNKYDFISISDLAEQIVAASTQNEIQGIINVCSGKPISLAEQVENYIKDNNYDIKLIYGVFPKREYDSPCIYGNNDKITKILKKYRLDKFQAL